MIKITLIVTEQEDGSVTVQANGPREGCFCTTREIKCYFEISKAITTVMGESKKRTVKIVKVGKG